MQTGGEVVQAREAGGGAASARRSDARRRRRGGLCSGVGVIGSRHGMAMLVSWLVGVRLALWPPHTVLCVVGNCSEGTRCGGSGVVSFVLVGMADCERKREGSWKLSRRGNRDRRGAGLGGCHAEQFIFLYIIPSA